MKNRKQLRIEKDHPSYQSRRQYLERLWRHIKSEIQILSSYKSDFLAKVKGIDTEISILEKEIPKIRKELADLPSKRIRRQKR